jgi:hypothetical protein
MARLGRIKFNDAMRIGELGADSTVNGITGACALKLLTARGRRRITRATPPADGVNRRTCRPLTCSGAGSR